MESVDKKNVYIEGFLTRNGFKKMNDTDYASMTCVVKVLVEGYEIQFSDAEFGEVSLYTDNFSIPQLTGILTWHNLIDRNYSK